MYGKNQIVAALEAIKRPRLAQLAQQSWELSLAEYSHGLYQNLSRPMLENELVEALAEECQRLGHSQEATKAVGDSFSQLGVLQTTTHVALTEGPTFLAAHQLATLGLPAQSHYIVAAFSGVPFSNSAWPACLNYSKRYSVSDIVDPACPGFKDFLQAEKNRQKDTSDRRLSLIPGKYRDARVYRSQLDDKIKQIQPFLNPQIANYLPPSARENSFTRWALKAAENQLGAIISHQPLVYIDLNEMICNYLQKVIAKPQHPIHRLFFDHHCQTEVLQCFGRQLPIFTLSFKRKGKWKQQNAWLENDTIISAEAVVNFDQESLLAGLDDGRYCPSLFLSFIILTFINGIDCLGGFNQIEYLHSYREKLASLSWLDQECVHKAKVNGLTSGLSTDKQGQRLFPLDIILGSRWEVDKSQTMGQWLQPLLEKLLNQ